MPTLDITADLLEQMPYVAKVVIGATMLWPDSEQEREDAIHAGKVDIINAVREATSGQNAVLSFDEETFAWMMWNGPRIKDLDFGDRVEGGRRAGRILLELLGHNQLGRPVGLQTIKADIEKRDGIAGPNRDRGPHAKRVSTVVEDGWRRFRPVAHLWSACQLLPNSQDVVDVLACAENLRRQAEALKMKHARTPVLPLGEAWRVPPDISLPAGKVHYRATPRH